ncbi:MAG TPA: hypothetical protein VK750_01985 [Cytophagaceae bacterium]|jgi:hypothetical protein|nr:hypothetical protein [Cytophagaceae bacterium]
MNPTPHYSSDSNTTIFLLGAILNLLASTEWGDLIDYSIKALIGGVIWLIFKVISNYLSHKLTGKKGDGPDFDGEGD